MKDLGVTYRKIPKKPNSGFRYIWYLVMSKTDFHYLVFIIFGIKYLIDRFLGYILYLAEMFLHVQVLLLSNYLFYKKLYPLFNICFSGCSTSIEFIYFVVNDLQECTNFGFPKLAALHI